MSPTKRIIAWSVPLRGFECSLDLLESRTAHPESFSRSSDSPQDAAESTFQRMDSTSETIDSPDAATDSFSEKADSTADLPDGYSGRADSRLGCAGSWRGL